MDIKDILSNSNTIAIVGFSDNHTRPSNRVGRYLSGNGYLIYGVNPKFERKIIDEIQCFAKIKDVPVQIDIVNVFRRSEYVYDLIGEIIELGIKPKVIWTQIGVISNEARELAISNDIHYVQNKCIMVEHTVL